jgi:hypothetical protein
MSSDRPDVTPEIFELFSDNEVILTWRPAQEPPSPDQAEPEAA